MIKKNIFILLQLCLIGLHAQEPTHNYGNLKIHDQGAIGFHYDLINDGTTDTNEGLAGFYNNNTSIIVSGAFRPIFKDMEVMVTKGLFLQVGVGVTNNTNFIIGNVYTPRTSLDVTLDYINNAFYTGEANNTKVDGYAASTNKMDFRFPVGDDNRLRPLTVLSQNGSTNTKCAYFYEDPNNPSTFPISFDTENRTLVLTAVSTNEFWDLDGTEQSTAQLTWDAQSDIANLVTDLADLRVVGWNTASGIWENLGNTDLTGDMTSGTITSEIFLPDDYTILTFGTSRSTETITLDNFVLTPNADGVNDVLVIDAVSLSPNNILQIYNRWGRLVFEEKNYNNTFDGIANVSSVFKRNDRLPAGVYFYLISLEDIDIFHQGYLYLEQ